VEISRQRYCKSWGVAVGVEVGLCVRVGMGVGEAAGIFVGAGVAVLVGDGWGEDVVVDGGDTVVFWDSVITTWVKDCVGVRMFFRVHPVNKNTTTPNRILRAFIVIPRIVMFSARMCPHASRNRTFRQLGAPSQPSGAHPSTTLLQPFDKLRARLGARLGARLRARLRVSSGGTTLGPVLSLLKHDRKYP
jgi:hypothetical protein